MIERCSRVQASELVLQVDFSGVPKREGADVGVREMEADPTHPGCLQHDTAYSGVSTVTITIRILASEELHVRPVPGYPGRRVALRSVSSTRYPARSVLTDLRGAFAAPPGPPGAEI